MYITNIEKIDKDKIFVCNKIIGNYLILKGFPLLSQNNKQMFFSYNEDLNHEINNMPYYLKIFIKKGGCFK